MNDKRQKLQQALLDFALMGGVRVDTRQANARRPRPLAPARG